MSKAVTTKKEKNAVQKTVTPGAMAAMDPGAWGAPQKLTSRDIIIPRILSMQAMSKKVTAGEAKFGEFRSSLNGSVLGDLKNPIEFIPFYMEKVFIIFKDDKGTFKYSRQVPITSDSENHEFEALNPEDGKKEKWYRTLQFFVLLPSEIKENKALPYLISFRSASAKGGQRLATQMWMVNINAGKTPASMVMQLTGTKATNDKGTFIVMDVAESRESTPEEIATAFQWKQTVQAGKVQVDASDLEAEVSETSTSPMEAPESTDY